MGISRASIRCLCWCCLTITLCPHLVKSFLTPDDHTFVFKRKSFNPYGHCHSCWKSTLYIKDDFFFTFQNKIWRQPSTILGCSDFDNGNVEIFSLGSHSGKVVFLERNGIFFLAAAVKSKMNHVVLLLNHRLLLLDLLEDEPHLMGWT